MFVKQQQIKKLIIAFFILNLNLAGAATFDHAYKQWTKILSTYVVQGEFSSGVNYKKLKNNSEVFNIFLRSIEDVSSNDFDSFTQQQKLVFLINAYNALTLKLIIDHYPVKSIKDIGSFFTGPWKMKFFKLFGVDSNLDNIEHNFIRKNFDEPRIHFALVCASIGCPALSSHAYTEDKLEEQLEEAAVRFLHDSTRNRYLLQEKKLEISSIFKWYGEDFKNKYSSYLAFIASRITRNSRDQEELRSKEIKVTFLPYNWDLNETK